MGSKTLPGSAIPTPTGCEGTQYALRSGDTCQSVASARGFSVAGLLSANGLQSYCANFPTQGTLCIPAVARCRTYAVKSGDTCTKIAEANKLVWAQIISWNPVLVLIAVTSEITSGMRSASRHPAATGSRPRNNRHHTNIIVS